MRDSHVPEEWQGRGLLEEGENRARNARARAGGRARARHVADEVEHPFEGSIEELFLDIPAE